MNNSLKIGTVLFTTFVSESCKAQGTYLQVPMNVASSRLSPRFAGHNEFQVYEGTFGKQVSKGRYETTQQYEARSKREGARPLFGKVFMWSPLAFATSPHWCDYNADVNRLDAHFALAKDIQSSGLERDFNLNSPSTEVLNGLTQLWVDRQGSYNAQNAFGAEVRVYTKSEKGYGFQIVNWRDFPFVQFDGDSKYRVSCSIKVKPSQAPALEKRIRVLYMGYLTAPYRAQDYAYEGATYSSPFRYTAEHKYVCIRLKSIWFYDIVTGQIYGKISARHPASPKPNPSDVFRLQMQDKGEAVKKWQSFLIKRGLMKPPVTGTFGSLTREATKNFQKQYGLTVHGSVGPQTIRKAKHLGYQ